VDPCSLNPCANSGTCLSSGGRAFRCLCPPGYTGDRCDTAHCTSDFCRNGGTCELESDVLLKCSCASGFTGQRCATAINPCDSAPCLSGGTCIELSVGGYSCLRRVYTLCGVLTGKCRTQKSGGRLHNVGHGSYPSMD